MSRKEFFLSEIHEVKRTLVQFLRHPIAEIKNVPDWPWMRILGLHVILTSVLGAIAGILAQKSTFSIVIGLFFQPFLTLITLGIMTLFFYYCFQIFAERTIPARQLFTVIFFASIPQMFLRVLEAYVPPITLVGMAFTALLLLVGFVENFQIPRKLVIRLMAILYALLFTIWVWNQITSSRMEKNWSHDRIEAPEVQLGE